MHPAEGLRAAAYLAADVGSVRGSLLDADAAGWSVGLLGELQVDEPTDTRVLAGLSYGRYSFDGTRTSVSATADGWNPGPVGFSDVEADAFEWFLGIESQLYLSGRLRIRPAAFLRGASGSMDSFVEYAGTSAASPIGLSVGEDHYRSALAELSLGAEADATPRLVVHGRVGVQARLGDDDRVLEARLTGGGRPIRGEGEELSSDSVFLGLGGHYRITDSIAASLAYRAEFRSEADPRHGFSLGSTFRV